MSFAKVVLRPTSIDALTRRAAPALAAGLGLALAGCSMPNPAFGEISASATETTDESGSTTSAGTAGATTAGASLSGTGSAGETAATTGELTTGELTTGELTTGGVCVDADSDGVTDCDDDCDDSDPNASPLRPEICGDQVDNNCDDEIDDVALCMGLGTFVSALVGTDGASGTQLDPVRTINEGIDHAKQIGAPIVVYVAEGDYTESVTMVEGVDLRGGHHCADGDCSWIRAPEDFVSTIYAVDSKGVFAGPEITAKTTIEGFVIYGKDGAPDDLGSRAAISIDGGAPSIRDNTIYGPGIESCSNCYTAGVRVFGPTGEPGGAQIIGNSIYGGNAPPSGLYAGSHAISLRGADPPTATISRNTLKGGSSYWTRALMIDSAAGTKITSNDIHAGDQVTAGASSFAAYLTGEMELDGNLINADPGARGSCPHASSFRCGGLEIEGVFGRITNNVIVGMEAYESVGLHISDGESGTFGDLALINNTIHGGGSPDLNGISAGIMCNTAQGAQATFGRVRNNVVIGGEGLTRFGVFERDQGGKTCHPDDFDNNDLSDVDVLYRHWDGGSTSLLATIGEVNALSFASNNIDDDPELDGSFHLSNASACIDAGTDFEAPDLDLDNQPRPQGQGVDIGADEAG